MGRDCMSWLDNACRQSSLKLCSIDVVSTDLMEARGSSHGSALHLRVILLDAGVHAGDDAQWYLPRLVGTRKLSTNGLGGS